MTFAWEFLIAHVFIEAFLAAVSPCVAHEFMLVHVMQEFLPKCSRATQRAQCVQLQSTMMLAHSHALLHRTCLYPSASSAFLSSRTESTPSHHHVAHICCISESIASTNAHFASRPVPVCPGFVPLSGPQPHLLALGSCGNAWPRCHRHHRRSHGLSNRLRTSTRVPCLRIHPVARAAARTFYISGNSWTR